MSGPAVSCRCSEHTQLHILPMMSGVCRPPRGPSLRGLLCPWHPRTNSSGSSGPPTPPSSAGPPLIPPESWCHQSPWHLAWGIILQSFLSLSSSQSPKSADLTSWIPPKISSQRSAVEISGKRLVPSVYKEFLLIKKKKAETPKEKKGGGAF